MLEVKVIISTPELANAINNLATAIGGVKPPVFSEILTAIPDNQLASNTMSNTQYASGSPATIQTPPVNQTNPVNFTANTAPAQQTPSGTPVSNVPLAQAPQYTVDQIMAAGAALMDAGRGTELLNLLHSFGVQAVMDLKPEQIGAFATALRNMGAKI